MPIFFKVPERPAVTIQAFNRAGGSWLHRLLNSLWAERGMVPSGGKFRLTYLDLRNSAAYDYP